MIAQQKAASAPTVSTQVGRERREGGDSCTLAFSMDGWLIITSLSLSRSLYPFLVITFIVQGTASQTY